MPIIIPNNRIEVARSVAKIASDVSSSAKTALGFVKKTWIDDPESGTPITAAELNRIEDAISNLDTSVQDLQDSVSQAIDVKQDQTWDDIVVTAHERAGIVTVTVERWGRDDTATIFSAPSVAGHVKEGHRPSRAHRQLLGVKTDGTWLYMEVDAAGDVKVGSLYAPSDSSTWGSFSGTISYPVV